MTNLSLRFWLFRISLHRNVSGSFLVWPTTRGRWRCVVSTSVISVTPPVGHNMSKWSNSYFIFWINILFVDDWRDLIAPLASLTVTETFSRAHAGIAALVCRSYIVVLLPTVHVTITSNQFKFWGHISFLVPHELPASFRTWSWLLQTFSELNILGFFIGDLLICESVTTFFFYLFYVLCKHCGINLICLM